MNNYEIYYGDVIACLDASGCVPLDSTDYVFHRDGTLLRVLHRVRSVAHVQVTIMSQCIAIGRLHVDEAYRKSGLSNFMVLTCLIEGLRKGCNKVELNDDPQPVSFRLWKRFGLPCTAYTKVDLAGKLQAFENSQIQFCNKLGLAHMPYAMILSVDYPPESETVSSTRRGRRSSVGNSISKKYSSLV